jgi:hypothetical protein
MNEKRVDLDGALNWLAEYYRQVLANFQVQYRLLLFLEFSSQCRCQCLCGEIGLLDSQDRLLVP